MLPHVGQIAILRELLLVFVGCTPSEVEASAPQDLPINDAELVVVDPVICFGIPPDTARHVPPVAFLKSPVVLALLKDEHHGQAFSVFLQKLVSEALLSKHVLADPDTELGFAPVLQY